MNNNTIYLDKKKLSDYNVKLNTVLEEIIMSLECIKQNFDAIQNDNLWIGKKSDNYFQVINNYWIGNADGQHNRKGIIESVRNNQVQINKFLNSVIESTNETDDSVASTLS